MQSQTQVPLSWREEFRVHSYEVDFRGRASLETLCRYFQEAAWNHAERLGVGYERLRGENKFWVLSRMRCEIESRPAWGDIVTVETWPRPGRGAIALRDFEICSVDGVRLAAGSTAWLILDAGSRKPQRLDKVLASLGSFPERAALSSNPAKLEGPVLSGAVQQFNTRCSDLDVNAHVNNALYVRWLLDAFPVDFHRVHEVRELEINYLGETGAGEVVKVHSDGFELHEHSLSVRKADDTEVCRAKLRWKPSSLKSGNG